MKMILLTEGETMSRLFDLDWQLLADSCLMIIAIFVLFLALSYFPVSYTHLTLPTIA